MTHVTEIHNCRLCGSDKIDLIWNFGLSPLANKFKTAEDLQKVEFEAPLRYFKCSECHSVQLKDEVASEVLFNDYLYETPKNLIPHFKSLVSRVTEVLDLPENSFVIDIGSNNGLLLQEFKNVGHRVLGFEPAENIAQKATDNGIPTYFGFFNGGSAEEIAIQFRCPNLITCTNCFAHVSDLNEFVGGALTQVMDNYTYFVFENAYLLDTINNLDFGQAYFEHFYMHSVTPLQKLFEKYDLELFKIEYVDVQMGSIRGYVRRKDNQTISKDDSVEKAIQKEKDCGLQNFETYRDFFTNICQIGQDLREKLYEIDLQNENTCIYGWPAKMTLINKFFDLERFVDYVVEESPVKVGKYAPGTKLEIKSLEYFKENPAKNCLIGAYNFEKDIKEKNKWYKGKWINPLEREKKLF